MIAGGLQAWTRQLGSASLNIVCPYLGRERIHLLPGSVLAARPGKLTANHFTAWPDYNEHAAIDSHASYNKVP